MRNTTDEEPIGVVATLSNGLSWLYRSLFGIPSQVVPVPYVLPEITLQAINIPRIELEPQNLFESLDNDDAKKRHQRVTKLIYVEPRPAPVAFPGTFFNTERDLRSVLRKRNVFFADEASGNFKTCLGSNFHG